MYYLYTTFYLHHEQRWSETVFAVYPYNLNFANMINWVAYLDKLQYDVLKRKKKPVFQISPNLSPTVLSIRTAPADGKFKQKATKRESIIHIELRQHQQQQLQHKGAHNIIEAATNINRGEHKSIKNKSKSDKHKGKQRGGTNPKRRYQSNNKNTRRKKGSSHSFLPVAFVFWFLPTSLYLRLYLR